MAGLDTATRLAVNRTHLAHERTLMAWVRTAISLIGFGFTIYKFFSFEQGRNLSAAGALLSPRAFGMIMIATGLFALVASTFEHRATMRQMRADFGIAPRSVSLWVAGIVSVMGLMAFAAALLRA
jgi:putative membrane protein